MSYASDALIDALEKKNKRLEEENERLKLLLAQSDEACESYRDECYKLRTVCGSYMRRAYASAIEKGNPITIGIIENEALALGIEVSK